MEFDQLTFTDNFLSHTRTHRSPSQDTWGQKKNKHYCQFRVFSKVKRPVFRECGSLSNYPEQTTPASDGLVLGFRWVVWHTPHIKAGDQIVTQKRQFRKTKHDVMMGVRSSHFANSRLAVQEGDKMVCGLKWTHETEPQWRPDKMPSSELCVDF